MLLIPDLPHQQRLLLYYHLFVDVAEVLLIFEVLLAQALELCENDKQYLHELAALHVCEFCFEEFGLQLLDCLGQAGQLRVVVGGLQLLVLVFQVGAEYGRLVQLLREDVDVLGIGSGHLLCYFIYINPLNQSVYTFGQYGKPISLL